MARASETRVFAFYDTLRHGLREVVLDQEAAIDDLVDALLHLSYRSSDSPPRAIFTFLGPPSVGKAYLAEALAMLLGETYHCKRFDMEQYGDPDSAAQFIGPEGELIVFLREQPRAVLLFDAIEKADNQLQLALLKLLSSGSRESGIDCGEVIAVFTTTLASSLLRGARMRADFRENRRRLRLVLLEALAREKKAQFDTLQPALAPKLLAALTRGTVIVFQALSYGSMARIGKEALLLHVESFAGLSAIKVDCNDYDRLARLFTLTFSPRPDVREVKNRLPDLLLGRITDFIRDQEKYPRHVLCKLGKQAVAFVDKMFADADLASRLFKKNETVELEWKHSWRGRTLTLTVTGAVVQKVPQSAELSREDRPAITFSDLSFSDIAGNKAVKQNLRQVVKILKGPDLVRRFRIDMPKGMLLHGPPGVGKTMLAKAFAREAERPYVYVSGVDLFDPHAITAAYEKAREYAPSIVFLDGIDVKGLVEGGLYAAMPDDQLLLELDSLPDHPEESVFTVATAQNRDEVSPRLIAPNRIDTFIEVPELDRDARRFFIEKILAKPNDGQINVERVIRYISGMSGYDLQRIGKEASLYAIRNGLDVITEEILIEQINIIKYGSRLEKKHIRNLEQDLKITAYHEAGHAVLSHLLLPEIKIEQVTIAPRLQSMGFISYNIDDFAGNVCREELFSNICVLLAGRLSSIRKFGAKGDDTGAANDLEVATHQAYAAVASLGMDEEIGYVHTDTLSQNVSRQIFVGRVEERVMHWMRLASAKSEEMLEEHWEKVERLAEVLIRQEIVDGSELARIMDGREPSS